MFRGCLPLIRIPGACIPHRNARWGLYFKTVHMVAQPHARISPYEGLRRGHAFDFGVKGETLGHIVFHRREEGDDQ